MEKDYPYTGKDGSCHFKKSKVAATVSAVVNISKVPFSTGVPFSRQKVSYVCQNPRVAACNFSDCVFDNGRQRVVILMLAVTSDLLAFLELDVLMG